MHDLKVPQRDFRAAIACDKISLCRKERNSAEETLLCSSDERQSHSETCLENEIWKMEHQ